MQAHAHAHERVLVPWGLFVDVAHVRTAQLIHQHELSIVRLFLDPAYACVQDLRQTDAPSKGFLDLKSYAHMCTWGRLVGMSHVSEVAYARPGYGEAECPRSGSGPDQALRLW